ncbi:MAG: serine acetyltransferase [Acidobacteriia bacterium]|nr:serine acetyltransferase [Terriglobia bacterium]
MDLERLNRLASEFKSALDAQLAGEDRSESRLPSRNVVAAVCRHYVDMLFPLFFSSREEQSKARDEQARPYFREFESLLTHQICSALCFDARSRGERIPGKLEDCAAVQITALRGQLPDLARLFASDIDAAFSNDPAAPNHEEIMLSYPYIEAITVQRLAHRLYLQGVPFVPRMMTEVAHSRTGIDIHPGASIGESFFIDHGTGVVIGETATIGNKVTLYHGVTLGAFNPLEKDEQGQLRRGKEGKRHPDLEDHVTVYPGATILGGNTRVGHHSVIGGNVWLTHSVSPYSKVILMEPDLVIRNHFSSSDAPLYYQI